MRRLGIVIVITAAVLAYACGNTNNAKKDAAIDTGGGHHDAPADASHDAMLIDGPPGTVALTIHNYAGWCIFKVGSGSSYSPAVTTVTFVAPGAHILTAEPLNTSFVLGSNMWHFTDGDPGYGSARSRRGMSTIGEPGTQPNGSAL